MLTALTEPSSGVEGLGRGPPPHRERPSGPGGEVEQINCPEAAEGLQREGK